MTIEPYTDEMLLTRAPVCLFFEDSFAPIGFFGVSINISKFPACADREEMDQRLFVLLFHMANHYREKIEGKT